MIKPVILYHATTEKKAKLYRQTGYIKSPVRGFDTIAGAMAWAMKVGRKVIYKVEAQRVSNVHKLPDHHNEFGTAYWIDEDCKNFKCAYSATS